MPQIITGGVNPGAISGVDDVYVLQQNPNAVQLPGASTSTAASVGSASWGATNVAQVIGSGGDLVNYFGTPTTAAFDLPTDLNIMLQGGATNLRAVRVTDGTDIAAILKVNDNTGFASDTITVGGTFASGVALSATFTPVSGSAVVVNYTTQVGDTNLAGIAASLAAQINASSAVTGPNAFLQAATVAGAVITIKALVQGTAQNTIALVVTGTGVTLTAGGATFTGGAAAGVIASLAARYTGSYANAATVRVDSGSNSTSTSPTYRLTITFPNAVPEVYDNIVAYATVGGGFSGSTFQTNVVNAVNGTPALSALRGASSYFTATAGSSTIAPLTGTALSYTTAGTDGSTFAAGATSAQLGSDTANPKTGMYALSGLIGGGVFCLAGNTDYANASAPMIAFAARENAHAIIAFPTGTSSTSAQTLRQNSGIASQFATLLKDFGEFTDAVNNVIARRVSPAPFGVARLVTTSPETSPANQRIGLLTGTERTGAVQNVPYSPAELGALEQNGINVITNNAPGVGPAFAIRHNYNSLGPSDPRGRIAYSRMSQFLSASLAGVMGQFIGQVQSRQPNDPLREKIRSAYNDFIQRLIATGMLDAGSYVQCDLRNNPVSAISAGILRVDIVAVFMAVVDKIIVTQTGGQTARAIVNPTALTANS